jgi:hypothetical protein
VDARLDGVMTDVRSLLDLPAEAERPPRAQVEHVLTSGYAYALGLERERLRLERRLRTAIRTRDRQVAELSTRLALADSELRSVRTELSHLRAQALA